MLIQDKTIKQINSIIDNYLDSIIVFTAGKKSLSPSRIKELYKLGFLTKDIADDPLSLQAYWIGKLQREGLDKRNSEEALKDLKTKLLSQLSSSEQTALKLAGQTLVSELQKHKEIVKGIVNDLILSGNYTYRNATASPKEILDSLLLKRETVSKMVVELRNKSGDMFRNWKRVAVTELTNTMNAGAVDQIVRNNPKRSAEEIYVYKAIPIDFKTCKICLRVYLDSDGATPKVYSLSDLLSNGTNYGKNASDSLAVVGATHPNCRGLLLQLPDGWGFIKGSQNLKYYGPDFLWVRDKDGITN